MPFLNRQRLHVIQLPECPVAPSLCDRNWQSRKEQTAAATWPAIYTASSPCLPSHFFLPSSSLSSGSKMGMTLYTTQACQPNVKLWMIV